MRRLSPELTDGLQRELASTHRWMELTAPGDIRPARFSFLEKDQVTEKLRRILNEVAFEMGGLAARELSASVEATLSGNNRALYSVQMPIGGYSPHVHEQTGGGALFYKGSGQVRLGNATLGMQTGDFTRFPRGIAHGFVRLEEPSEVLAWQERGIVDESGDWDFVIVK